MCICCFLLCFGISFGFGQKTGNVKSLLWVQPILYSERQNRLKGLYVIICINPFFFGYVLFQHDVKNETSSMSLSCLYKPVNDELNLFDAAGLWISLTVQRM